MVHLDQGPRTRDNDAKLLEQLASECNFH